MKAYKIIILLFVVASCDLDREPFGAANYWNKEEDVKLAINGIYAPYYKEDGFGEGDSFLGSASDDFLHPSDKQANLYALAMFQTTEDSFWGTESNWQYMFQSIRRANDVIKNTPNITMSESSKNKYLGEANFLAGFDYFYLAKRYGGLPFFDVNKPDELFVPRETKTETFNRIETYLKNAVDYFEKEQLWTRSSDEYGKPNLGAAYGLLAKVYAHWGKFDKCKEYAEKVINSGKYSLDVTGGNGFKNIFSVTGEKNNTEVLFGLVVTTTENRGGLVTQCVFTSENISNSSGWKYYMPTKYLNEAFETGDKRRDVTLRGLGEPLRILGKNLVLNEEFNLDENGEPTTPKPGNIADMAHGLMGVKYFSGFEEAEAWSWFSGNDRPLLRYADVLLLHAEAIMQLASAGPSNPTVGVAEAANSLNLVRNRAGLASKSSPTFNDLVRERRCELAFEDERHYDLVRWGLAKSVYAANSDETMDSRGARSFDPVKNAHFPIPQKEIDNSAGKIINNPAPGYSTFE